MERSIYLLCTCGTPFLIDAEDFPRVAAHPWRVERYQNRRPTVATDLRIGRRYRKISLQRFLLRPRPGEKIVRSLRSEALDYRKRNFAIGPTATSKRITGKPRGNHSSRYKGVYCLKNGAWRAIFYRDGKAVSVGVFPTEEEAARAYDRAVRKEFGPDVFLNFR